MSRTRAKFFIIIFLALFAIIGYSLAPQRTATMTVSFLDIGQGDAILIQTPGGNDILIDGGPDTIVLSRLRDEMPYFDNSIELVAATHPDKDHIGGLLAVFDAYRVKALVASRTPSDTSLDETLWDKAVDEQSTIITPRQNQKIILDPAHGVVADVLFPDGDTTAFADTNAASLILRVTYGNTEIMLTGDAPAFREQSLVDRYGNTLKSDVLKLGHHGSKTSSAPLFLKAVSPTYAIVSAGKNNRYGHPDSGVIKRAEAYGAKILSTQELGTITFVSDGETLWLQK